MVNVKLLISGVGLNLSTCVMTASPRLARITWFSVALFSVVDSAEEPYAEMLWMKEATVFPSCFAEMVVSSSRFIARQRISSDCGTDMFFTTKVMVTL